MRKLLLGLFGLLALGFGAFTAQPAEAQPYYPGYRQHWGGPAVTVQFGPPRYEYRRPYRARRHYRPYRHYRYARPVYGRPVYAGRRCFVRPQRVWTDYGWVRRPVRVCRW
ncbi:MULTISPECIES: hypothetical protein [Microvirga]|uniref:hypothetical protein n=1 Tax=Microvirga TaxID=186650 RepID=UPI001CFF8D0C|nr:hypothetical protein [Microvirga lenta]MCB5175290.1 hypothetical protein [Microvirga lenta]